MKLFKFFIAIFAMVVGISLNSHSQARFSTQYFSYDGTNTITLRTSWNTTTLQTCNAPSGDPCYIATAPTGDGHPDATTFSNLITPSASFTQPATLAPGQLYRMKP